MLRNHKGVTLMEITTVLTLMAAMMMVGLPKMRETRRSASMSSARTKVESYLTVARSVAIRSGVRSVLIRQGNTLKIMADSANGLVVVVQPIQLDTAAGIKLEVTRDTLIYDARGLAMNLSTAGEKFYITASNYGAAAKDSICVTRLGLILDRKCGLVAIPDKSIPIDTGGGIILDGGPITTDPVVK
jgi:hypothetical protein